MNIHPRELIIAALFDAWGLAMPVLFHAFGLGAVFLPMFIPLLIMGFFVGPATAVLNAFMVPLISALLTGMPPLYPPLAVIISFETAALAGIASLCYRTAGWNMWVSMIAAIAAERFVLAAAAIWIAPLFAFPPFMLSIGSLAASMPGILLLIVITPIVIKSIHKLQKPIATQ